MKSPLKYNRKYQTNPQKKSTNLERRNKKRNKTKLRKEIGEEKRKEIRRSRRNRHEKKKAWRRKRKKNPPVTIELQQVFVMETPKLCFQFSSSKLKILSFWAMETIIQKQAKHFVICGTHSFWMMNHENWVISLSFHAIQTSSKLPFFLLWLWFSSQYFLAFSLVF